MIHCLPFDRLVDPEPNAAERVTNRFVPFRRVETRHEDPAANKRAMRIAPILLWF